jgi:hypothetical protein
MYGMQRERPQALVSPHAIYLMYGLLIILVVVLMACIGLPIKMLRMLLAIGLLRL